MSKMQHFKNVSYVNPNFRVELSLDRFSKQFADAQQWLGDRVLEDCKPFMPHLTGSLQDHSQTENGGKRVVFPGPHSRYLYGGKVMVDSVTGKGPCKISTGPNEYIFRFRAGADLVPTERPLKYSSPQAKPKWFEEAKEKNLEYWLNGVKKRGGGG